MTKIVHIEDYHSSARVDMELPTDGTEMETAMLPFVSDTLYLYVDEMTVSNSSSMTVT